VFLGARCQDKKDLESSKFARFVNRFPSTAPSECLLSSARQFARKMTMVGTQPGGLVGFPSLGSAAPHPTGTLIADRGHLTGGEPLPRLRSVVVGLWPTRQLYRSKHFPVRHGRTQLCSLIFFRGFPQQRSDPRCRVAAFTARWIRFGNTGQHERIRPR
jgi:hypothetical protein